MSEKKTLTIASISDEITSQNGNKYWKAETDEGVSWATFNAKVAEAIPGLVGTPAEYYVSIRTKGDTTYRNIEGIPGVVEPEKKGGRGNKSWAPRQELEAAAIRGACTIAARCETPDMALEFAKKAIPQLIQAAKGSAGGGAATAPSPPADTSSPSEPPPPHKVQAALDWAFVDKPKAQEAFLRSHLSDGQTLADVSDEKLAEIMAALDKVKENRA